MRYDAGHKRDTFLADTFGRFVEWVAVCPEFEIGLGVPRDPLHLADSTNGVRLIVTKTGEDLTRRMAQFSAQRLEAIGKLRLSGYVLKSKSPSCGMEQVLLYRRARVLQKTGRGLFAVALMEAFPDLPVEDEGRLLNARRCESFITHVYAHHRWHEMMDGGVTRASLIRFHERHKFLLASRNQTEARQLGALLGEASPSISLESLARAYQGRFSELMKRTPTRKNHTNVLQHLAGFLKDHLKPRERQELGNVIDRYRQAKLSLLEPITMLRTFAAMFDVYYLSNQVYLNPHPDDLKLLSQV